MEEPALDTEDVQPNPRVKNGLVDEDDTLHFIYGGYDDYGGSSWGFEYKSIMLLDILHFFRFYVVFYILSEFELVFQ